MLGPKVTNAVRIRVREVQSERHSCIGSSEIRESPSSAFGLLVVRLRVVRRARVQATAPAADGSDQRARLALTPRRTPAGLQPGAERAAEAGALQRSHADPAAADGCHRSHLVARQGPARDRSLGAYAGR